MKTLDVSKYSIEELESNVGRLIELLHGATLEAEVQLKGMERIKGWGSHAYFNFYGTGSYHGCASAGLLTDGRVLVINAEGTAFAGTFASHHNTWTRSFLLTPPAK